MPSASASAAYAAAAVSAGRTVTPPPQAARPRVLVVDDSPDVLVALGAFAEGAGCEPVTATNAEDALRVLAADPAVQVLVTDLAMPGASGAELVAQARTLRPGLPALVVTGYPGADVLASLPPRVEVLPKPFRRQEFIGRLHALLSPRTGAPAPVSLTI